MTSPVGGKPESTQDKYDDVHSIGSSFGSDLTESSVRNLLSTQIESPFSKALGGLVNSVGDLIGDIADAISGVIPTGARTEPIMNAIVAKMSPLESEVQALGESLQGLSSETIRLIQEQASLIENAEGEIAKVNESLASQKAFAEETREITDEAKGHIEEAKDMVGVVQERVDNAQNLALESHSLLFDQQHGWNAVQEDINESLTKATEANTQAIAVQNEMNLLVQEQLWTQQDMIEQLDIQATKIYFGAVDSVRYPDIPSWVGWSSATPHIFPFVHFYTRNASDRMVKWQLTGKWDGRVKVTTNWSNGATDIVVFDVLTTGVSQSDGRYSRTQTTSGGAAFVDLRNATFEVYPHNLHRQSRLTLNDGIYSLVEEDRVSGFPSMIRYQGDRGFRFSCPVTCNKELMVNVFENGEWVLKTIPPNRMIMPALIDWSRAPSSAVFSEAKMYSV